MTVTSKGNRCGNDWVDANTNCNAFCTSEAECAPFNMTCFSGLTEACPIALTRCGTSFSNANLNCNTYCLNDDWCPGNQTCFSDVADICDFRCGVDWTEANKDCRNQCRTGSAKDCPDGKQCFGSLEKQCKSHATMIGLSPIIYGILLLRMSVWILRIS